jgi:hypothetical protein
MIGAIVLFLPLADNPYAVACNGEFEKAAVVTLRRTARNALAQRTAVGDAGDSATISPISVCCSLRLGYAA